MLGTLVNAGAIVVGSFVGLLLKKGLPEKITDAIMKGVALCVLYIGLDGCLEGDNALIAILSIVLGALVGTALDLDGRLCSLGDYMERKLQAGGGSFSTAFVTASLLFCVGAMDGISSVVCAATLGPGVLMAGVAVLLYQGAITLLAQALAPVLNDAVVAEMTCVGSLLIIGLELNMLGVTKLKVMNYVPAVFVAIGVCYLF